MYNEKITYYARNPVNKWELENYDVKFMEDNRVCWDDLTVYVKICDNKIADWKFTWDTTMITTACASIFWESIIDMDINEILQLGYDYIEGLVWMPITRRRKQAAVLWLLTTINALHLYLNDWQKIYFDDLID